MAENSGKTNINRTISVGINVDDPAQLPKIGEQLARLLRKMDGEHGPFDVTIGIAVNGFVSPAAPAMTTINHFYDGHEEDYEEEDA